NASGGAGTVLQRLTMRRASSLRTRVTHGRRRAGAQPRGEGVRVAAFTECRHPLLWRTSCSAMLNADARTCIYLNVPALLARAGGSDGVPLGRRAGHRALLGSAPRECREAPRECRADLQARQRREPAGGWRQSVPECAGTLSRLRDRAAAGWAG